MTPSRIGRPRTQDGRGPRVRDVRRRSDLHVEGGRRREELLLLLDDLHGDVPGAGEGEEATPFPRPLLLHTRGAGVPPLPRDGTSLDSGRVDGPAHGGRLPPSDAGPVRPRSSIL